MRQIFSNQRLPGEREDVRCVSCSKLLAKANLDERQVEIKCARCATFNCIGEQASEQIIITDKTGKILYANESCEKITGFSLSEIIGETPKLWGGQMPKEFYKKMWDTISGDKKEFRTSVINKNKDGVLYEADLKVIPVFDEKGEIAMYIGIEKFINFQVKEAS